MKAVIKRLTALAVLTTLFATQNNYTAPDGWLQPWDRPEYTEWAAEIPEGYELHIIRPQADNYLVVKAKLLMGPAGLPGFEVVTQLELEDEQTALEQVNAWREEYSKTYKLDAEQLHEEL